MSCDRRVNYTVAMTSLPICFNLVAGNLARLIMCCLAVMLVTAATTVNVDRVSWINGTNMLLVYFLLLLLASEVGQLILFWQLLGVLLQSGFHESDLIFSSVYN